jgi:23S rRNA (pseudouridine1915-N3)-methyltransferase
MITIISVGNIKEQYMKDAIKDYETRISKYTKIKMIEIKGSEYDDINKDLKEEASRMIKHIKNKDHLIVLDVNGDEYSSVDFSKKIDNILTQKDITFVIGGSNGIDKSIKDMSNDILSFSKFTFPHQLFKLVLCEQIYRGFKIINNETYHK